MEILGWVIWLVACGWGIFNLIGFFCEIFWPSPEWPQALYPFFLRRLITGFIALGFIGAAVATAFTGLSKFHLLWFVPAWHYFGIHRWVELIYLLCLRGLVNLVYPVRDGTWWDKFLFVPHLVRFIERYQTQKRETAAKGWDRFPIQFVRGLKETLGEEMFESLTLLAGKYHLLDQDFFRHPDSFRDMDDDMDIDELTKVSISGLLTSMGNELLRRNIVDDSEKVFRIALILHPEQFGASGMLAVICHCTARAAEAREHALRAMADMDSIMEQTKDIPIPKHLFPDLFDPKASASVRSVLQSIAEGKV